MILIFVQALLDFRNFRLKAVYDSILFSSSLALLSNLNLQDLYVPRFFMCPPINSVNRGMPVHIVSEKLTN